MVCIFLIASVALPATMSIIVRPFVILGTITAEAALSIHSVDTRRRGKTVSAGRSTYGSCFLLEFV